MSTTPVWPIVILAIAVFFNSFREAHSKDPDTYFDGTDMTHTWTGYKVHHTIDQVSYGISDDQIYLAVAARASEGFVGIGIAKSGGMHGAILDEQFPLRDDCESWTLLTSQMKGVFLIFEAVRLLDTGDTQNRLIVEDGAPSILASLRLE